MLALLLAAALSVPAPQHPLPQADVAAQLKARWQGKTFYLRGFPASDRWRTDDRGRPLTPLPPESWTLAGIHVDNVRRKGSELRIDGTRVFYTFDGDHHTWLATIAPDSERIEIDVASPVDLDALQSGLFLTSLSELSANVPDEWKPVLSGASQDEILNMFIVAAGLDPNAPAAGAFPKKLNEVDPQYSDAARQLRLQGIVEIAFSVGVNGTVTRAILLRPLGAGLDETALAAVRAWRYEPTQETGAQLKPRVARAEMGFKAPR
ncbi:MAG TPA: energy transducer TonB [Terriglobales bacterium]|nr:energy transducer TonB [Terriglobales bacterium]